MPGRRGACISTSYSPRLVEVRRWRSIPSIRTRIGIGLVKAAEALARVREYRTVFAVSSNDEFFRSQGTRCGTSRARPRAQRGEPLTRGLRQDIEQPGAGESVLVESCWLTSLRCRSSAWHAHHPTAATVAAVITAIAIGSCSTEQLVDPLLPSIKPDGGIDAPAGRNVPRSTLRSP